MCTGTHVHTPLIKIYQKCTVGDSVSPVSFTVIIRNLHVPCSKYYVAYNHVWHVDIQHLTRYEKN